MISDGSIIMAKIGVGIIQAKILGRGREVLFRLKSDFGVRYYIG